MVKNLRRKLSKQFLIILFFIISNLTFSQESTLKFQSILESTLTVSEKEKKMDSLLNDHLNKNNIEAFLGDRFEFIKWNYQQNNLQKAIQLNKENLKFMDSLQFNGPTFYRRNVYSLGFYLMSNNDNYGALKNFNALIDAQIVDEYAYNAYAMIAQIAYNSEDYFLAAEKFENAIAFAKKNDNIPEVISNILRIGYAFKIIKSEKSIYRGIILVNEGLELLNKYEDQLPYSDLYRYTFHELLGDFYNEKKDVDFEKSSANYNNALQIALKLNDSLRLADIHNNIGYLYLKNSKENAIDFFNKAFTYNPDQSISSILNRNKSEYYLKNKNKLEALRQIQKSIHNLTKIDTLNFESLPRTDLLKQQEFKFLLLSSIIDKARIWIDLRQQNPINGQASYQNALKTMRLADQLVDIIRLETSENKSKLFWRETASEIYVNATKVCFELNLPKEAFYFIEKNKALLLLEDINKRTLIGNSNIPKTIIDNEASLSADITKYSLSELDKEAYNKAKDNYRSFMDSIDNVYRLYFKVQKPADVIELDELQKNLDSKTAYLEFILDDEKGYGFLITNDLVKFYEIEDISNLKQNVRQFRKLLNKPIVSISDQNTYNSVSNSIYSSLFPKDIRVAIQYKSLKIIPDYYLQNIPFEALQTNTNTHSYLIFENDMSYAYSATLLQENGTKMRSNNQNFIGFAPINFKELSTLNSTKTELESIDKLFPSNLFIETEATKSNFVNSINDYNIIHVASHANTGSSDDVNPWIQFYDERLSLQELYQLEHSADLVVLSACETSLGENYKGEGVMSLTRGFFSSGANSVVSTLWNINDKSSTEIMEFFYENLKNGDDKKSALHKAKLQYIKSSELSEKSPYYWASFILIGDTGSVTITDNTSIIYYVVVGLLVLFMVMYFYQRKK